MLRLKSAKPGPRAHNSAIATRGGLGVRPLLICLALALGAFLVAPAAGSANPITVENANPGNATWERPQADTPNIDGYTDKTSVAPGETLGFHGATNPAGTNNYTIRIYRLGCYNGAGAREMSCSICGT